MSTLRVTLIDVGCGDSILLESTDRNGEVHFGLIDANDTTYLRSSFIFLKRFFETKKINRNHHFDFVLLTHEHSDHAQGLKSILREFGAKRFWYPKSLSLSSFAVLIRFANRSARVSHHESVNSGKILPNFGDVTMKVLWPPWNVIDRNPNNNSVVISLNLGGVSVVLTGDAEEAVWTNIAGSIPPDTEFFKVPHHGSENGTFDRVGNPCWLPNCPATARLAISTHITPHKLPDQKVLDEFSTRGMSVLRTDEHYHLIFETDGRSSSVAYTHP
jgi:competence protein ComEC